MINTISTLISATVAVPIEMSLEAVADAVTSLTDAKTFDFGGFSIFQGFHPDYGFVRLIAGALGTGALLLLDEDNSKSPDTPI